MRSLTSSQQGRDRAIESNLARRGWNLHANASRGPVLRRTRRQLDSTGNKVREGIRINSRNPSCVECTSNAKARGSVLRDGPRDRRYRSRAANPDCRVRRDASQRRNRIGADRGWWRSLNSWGGLNGRLVDPDEAASLVPSVKQVSARAT